MQERLAAINARLDVTEFETARLAAERPKALSVMMEAPATDSRISPSSAR
jgi:hypothetical protein